MPSLELTKLLETPRVNKPKLKPPVDSTVASPHPTWEEEEEVAEEEE